MSACDGAARALCVLVAEDNAINQKVVASCLRKAGHIVDFVDNGLAAVAAVERGDYDVVLMDVQMPELDGLKAAQRIRKLPAPACATPIIALTANAARGAEKECLAAGMDDYVAKPIDPKLVLAKLNVLARALADDAPAEASAEIPVAAAQPPRDAPAVIDASPLAALETVMSWSELETLLTTYLDETAKRLAQIRALASAHDHAAAAREAHAIVSTSGSVGAMRLSALAREYEHACQRCDDDAMGKLEPELAGAVVSADAGLRRWLASYALAS